MSEAATVPNNDFPDARRYGFASRSMIPKIDASGSPTERYKIAKTAIACGNNKTDKKTPKMYQNVPDNWVSSCCLNNGFQTDMIISLNALLRCLPTSTPVNAANNNPNKIAAIQRSTSQTTQMYAIIDPPCVFFFKKMGDDDFDYGVQKKKIK